MILFGCNTCILTNVPDNRLVFGCVPIIW